MDYKLLLAVALLVTVAECQSVTSSSTVSEEFTTNKQPSEKPDELSKVTNKPIALKSSESTDKYIFAEMDATTAKKQPLKQNGRKDLSSLASRTDAGLIFLETFIRDGDKILDGIDYIKSKSVRNEDVKKGSKSSANTPNSTAASKLDRSEVRRQGNLNPQFAQRQTRTNVDFDDRPRDNAGNNYPVRSEQRIQSSLPSDGVPFLQLTQGGYQRPYQQPGTFNDNRQIANSESVSQQSERVETSDGASKTNDQSTRPQVVPQVTYVSQFQPPQYALGDSPLFRSPFESPIGDFGTGVVQGNGGFLNAPSSGFPDFATANFQTQFPSSNVPLFQAPSSNIFPNTGFLFQSSPQTPPVAVDASASYQPNNFPGFQSFDSGDASKPDFTMYFRNPNPFSSQFQVPTTFFGTNIPASGSALNNPPISLLSNYPTAGPASPFSSRFLRNPVSDGQVPSQNDQQEDDQREKSLDASQNAQNTKETEPIKESPNKNDPTLVPFGTRLQRENEGQRQNNVYIRYPMREAGYATEENLPPQNVSDEQRENSETPQKPSISYFPGNERFEGISYRDPYRNALNRVRQEAPSDNGRSGGNANGTYGFPGELLFGSIPGQFDYPQQPGQIFEPYPNRNQDLSTFPSSSFYPRDGIESNSNPFDRLTSLPESRYQLLNTRPNQIARQEQSNVIPLCAREHNASICFQDAEYPKREILYSLNTDSLSLERLASRDLQLDGMAFLDQNVSESSQGEDNYICRTDIKYGTPLRAKNFKGAWKIVVNLEKTVGGERFMQPVRLEVCRGSGETCSYTDSRVKTACVQKYSLQRLLSWSPEMGVHNDMYKFPVACSCQIVKEIEV